MTGWDRPLQQYFLVVEDEKDLYAENDNYVFSNLNLPNPAMTLEQVKTVLAELNIRTPPTLFDDLAQDKTFGNASHHYGEI